MADMLTPRPAYTTGCWRIPEDEVIRGRCKRCGATRDYPASVEGASRQGVYDEAASLSKRSSLLPDVGRQQTGRPDGRS